MKWFRADLIKASSMAMGLVMVITILGHYVIPPYVFVSPGYFVCVGGIVDHKSIGHGYSDGEPRTWYTVSVKLFNDDPVNQIKSGETLAYIVSKTEWEMVEWGDPVKIRLLPDAKAEIVEIFPSLKLPRWHGLAGSASPISIELVANKSSYTLDEKANFSIIIKNAPEEKGWIGPSIPLKLTLFKTFPLWIFRSGEKIYSSPSNLEPQNIVLEPYQELMFSFEWELIDNEERAVSEGLYYVRVYLGYFTEDEEITLTGTTMIGIEA
jgi:hypothetical protein